MFYDRRVIDINDGLPKWSEMQNKSDLIADSPPEAIKKRKREIEDEKEKNGNEENGDREGKSVKK